MGAPARVGGTRSFASQGRRPPSAARDAVSFTCAFLRVAGTWQVGSWHWHWHGMAAAAGIRHGELHARCVRAPTGHGMDSIQGRACSYKLRRRVTVAHEYD